MAPVVDAGGWLISWDSRLDVLIGLREAAEHTRTIRLGDSRLFRDDMRSTAAREMVSQVINAFTDRQAAQLPTVSRRVLGRIGPLLLAYGLKEAVPSLVTDAKRLLYLLGPDGHVTAWRVAFDESLDHERRYRLLRPICEHLSGSYRGDSPVSDLKPGEGDIRQAHWWTVRCLQELACDWHADAAPNDESARKGMRDASLMYLGVLKNELRRQELERFLIELGSNLEHEVSRVLLPSKQDRGNLELHHSPKDRSWAHPFATVPLLSDEVVRRVFILWSLKRYNLGLACEITLAGWTSIRPNAWKRVSFTLWSLARCDFRLAYQMARDEWKSITADERERASFIAAGGLGLCAFGAFYNSICVPNWLYFNISWLVVQVAFQLGALLIGSIGAPTLFRLVGPRSLFGSLLAWITIMLPMLLGVPGVTLPTGAEMLHDTAQTSTLADVIHNLMTGSRWIWNMAAVVVPTLVVSFVFVVTLVINYVHRPWEAAKRALSVLLLIMLPGACFWGILFAPLVRVLLHRSSADDGCLVPIAAIGSSLAVLVGILAQLLWEDRAITEPLGEPL